MLKLRKIQMEQGVSEESTKKIILDVNTRWNSVFYMVERFLEMLTNISELLLDDCLSPEMPNAHEIDTLKQLVLLLKPFEYVSKETSGENYLTISKIIPMISCLHTSLLKFSSNNSNANEILDIFKSEINRRFSKIEFNSHIAVSTLLDPRFKNVNFQNAVACSQAIQKLRAVIVESTAASSSDSELESSPQTSSAKFDFWQHHRDLVIGRKKRKTQMSDEVSVYLSSPISSLKSKPLEEWEDMKTTFPQLYKQARLYLSIVGSSVPCERLFSKAGATMSQTRNRLSGQHLEKLLFLGNISKKQFFS